MLEHLNGRQICHVISKVGGVILYSAISEDYGSDFDRAIDADNARQITDGLREIAEKNLGPLADISTITLSRKERIAADYAAHLVLILIAEGFERSLKKQVDRENSV